MFGLVSCFRSEPQQPAQQSDTSTAPIVVKTTPLHAIFPSSRTLDTLFYADVLGSGIPKTFVFSVAKDSSHLAPSFAQFDLMQTYNWSVGDSSWKLAEVDSFAYGTGVRVQDITRD
ncbi:MAG TPA: hypothetical protein VFA55_08910, partial [Candidatus Kapabacteria bacterium]|nr:hypothetical protein [Candidatus Kapabacteria bacterium]